MTFFIFSININHNIKTYGLCIQNSRKKSNKNASSEKTTVLSAPPTKSLANYMATMKSGWLSSKWLQNQSNSKKSILDSLQKTLLQLLELSLVKLKHVNNNGILSAVSCGEPFLYWWNRKMTTTFHYFSVNYFQFFFIISILNCFMNKPRNMFRIIFFYSSCGHGLHSNS